jgi:hypothetical protein
MANEWVVTTSTERIMLADGRRAEATFTVSNQGRVADRAVFDVVPGDGADRSWFSVEDPQRLVPVTGSVAYLVSVNPPADAPPGSYSMQGRVYSADSAPEESSVLSGRIVFDVGASTAPTPKPRPWWLIAVVALVVLVVGVVTWLVFAGGDDELPSSGNIGATPPPATTQAASAQAVRMPNLASLTLEQATSELTNFGLAVGTVKHRHSPGQANTVMEQGTAAATTVPAGTKVDLVVGVNLTAPTITAPGNGATFAGGSQVDVRWNQSEIWVDKWKIITTKQNCYYYIGHEYRDCRWDNQANAESTTTVYRTSFSLSYQPLLNLGNYHTGLVRATVTAVDDFGNTGSGATVEYWIR